MIKKKKNVLLSLENGKSFNSDSVGLSLCGVREGRRGTMPAPLRGQLQMGARSEGAVPR